MKGINTHIPHYNNMLNPQLKGLANQINASPVHEAHVAKAFGFAKGQKQDHKFEPDNYKPGTGSPWLAMKGK